jgi:hypothetical protein
VVWTGLESNFKEKVGVDFTVDAAANYLKGLNSETAAIARDYIRRAPPPVRTPLRDAIEQDPWFNEE